MNIWLDDNHAGDRPAPEGFEHAHTLAELQALLAERPDDPIDIMCFDNDLGAGEPEGYDIIKWMYEHCVERWPRVVECQSENPIAKKLILAYDAQIRKHVLPGIGVYHE